jgi:hypothetical protein
MQSIEIKVRVPDLERIRHIQKNVRSGISGLPTPNNCKNIQW